MWCSQGALEILRIQWQAEAAEVHKLLGTQQDAAVRIQALQRGSQTRETQRQVWQLRYQQDQAATRIQALQRGIIGRKELLEADKLLLQAEVDTVRSRELHAKPR